MFRAILFVALVALATANKVSYENYKVFKVIPKSNEDLELITHIGNFNKNYNFWTEPTRVNHPVHLMVSPDQQETFSELMDATEIPYETYIENVQTLINQENPKGRSTGFSFTKYNTLEEIYEWLESLPKQYPGKVEVINAGKTYQKRVIKGVKLSFGKNKPGVFLEGGIHAREWIAPATVTYLLNEFLTSKDPAVRKLAESYDWYMFPSFNPDGYVYTHTTNRLWRKTVSNLDERECGGADANRNWGYQWMVAGSSDYPCGETYAGSSEFSEIETRSMSKYIASIGDKLFAYIGFHSFSQLLLFPYGHTREHLDNFDEQIAMGTKALSALYQVHGTRYTPPGNIAETIYPASGNSMDWVKHNLKLPVTFTYELRDTGRNGFVLPADQIIPNGEEVLASFVAMFQEATRLGYPKKH